ncbi:uncharacterized protein M6B38_189690 [Iris pallida]|uniref:Uncharacterized protein n=1 Tax=Iris pallida TaxID=29817 RepID=A0AAX6EIW0_IRIPA|nr:uncharacterized protein M6B38_189690 [Iris pallida]
MAGRAAKASSSFSGGSLRESEEIKGKSCTGGHGGKVSCQSLPQRLVTLQTEPGVHRPVLPQGILSKRCSRTSIVFEVRVCSKRNSYNCSVILLNF